MSSTKNANWQKMHTNCAIRSFDAIENKILSPIQRWIKNTKNTESNVIVLRVHSFYKMFIHFYYIDRIWIYFVDPIFIPVAYSKFTNAHAVLEFMSLSDTHKIIYICIRSRILAFTTIEGVLHSSMFQWF